MPRPTPAHLIDLAVQLDRDQRRPVEELRDRDRAIGRSLSEAGVPVDRDRDEPELLAAWLERLPGEQVDRTRRLQGLAWGGLMVLAAAIGWATAMGVFYYDGSSPVNVVNALAVFVGLQLLLLALMLIVALPAAAARWVPGLIAVQQLLAAVNLGRIHRLALRYLPVNHREAIARAVGRSREHRAVYGHAQKWVVLGWSQSFALVFNLFAVLGFVQLVLFSDLAFGWATTLQVSSERFHGLISEMAWPWSWIVAPPGLELVETSRHYRLADWERSVSQPQQFGRWWPFVLGAMVAYGLIPRVATAAVAAWRLRLAVRRAIVLTPGAAVVVDRLTAPVVRTEAEQPEAPEASAAEPAPLADRVDPVATIAWSGAQAGDDALRAGGERSLAEDRAAIEAAGEAVDAAEGGAGRGGVAVRVKAWEPPLLELMDFLGELRDRLGDGPAITVVAVGGRDRDRAQWRTKLAAAGDPWLRVAEDPAEPATAVGGDA